MRLAPKQNKAITYVDVIQEHGRICIVEYQRTLRITNVVLLSCKKGTLVGDNTPWMASGISRATCNKNTADLVVSWFRTIRRNLKKLRKLPYRGLRRWIVIAAPGGFGIGL
jgi:hypothetical protein